MKKDYAIHVNKAEILGRVGAIAVKGSTTRVIILAPAYDRDKEGMAWHRFVTDFVDKRQKDIVSLEVGDFIHVDCKIVDKEINVGEGTATMKMLMADGYGRLGIQKAKAPADPLNPPMSAICHASFTLCGKLIIPKASGLDHPELKTSKAGKPMTFFTVAYTDPFQTGKGEDEYGDSQYFRVSAFGKRAEFITSYATNQSQFVVTGTMLIEGMYQDSTKKTLALFADDISFANKYKGGDNGAIVSDADSGFEDFGDSSSATPPVIDDDDIPF